VPRELDAFTADFQRTTILEDLVGHGARRVVVALEESPSLFVADTGDVLVEERRCSDVICVMMRIDEMRDLVAHAILRRDLVDSASQVVPIVGGASRRTTPSRVVRNADWYVPSVTQ
jgi:hypothetical protein